MAEFVTVTRKDDDFKPYLKGTFSSDKRAIPAHSFYRQNGEVELTFELVDLERISRPGFFRRWLIACKPPYLTLSLTPLICLLGLMTVQGAEILWPRSLIALFGVLFLQVSAHFFNEYFDHIDGRDHRHPNSGTGVIANGWMAAHGIHKIAWLTFLISLVIGVYVLKLSPEVLPWSGTVLMVGIFGFMSQKYGFKDRGIGELVLFSLGGPLFVLPFAIVSGGEVNFEIVLLGLIFGVYSAQILHLKNLFEMRLMASNKAVSLAQHLGFDRSKFLALILPWSAAFLALIGVIFFLWRGELASVFFWGVVLVGGALLARVSHRRIRSITSSLSSRLKFERGVGVVYHFLLGGVFLLGIVFRYFLM